MAPVESSIRCVCVCVCPSCFVVLVSIVIIRIDGLPPLLAVCVSCRTILPDRTDVFSDWFLFLNKNKIRSRTSHDPEGSKSRWIVFFKFFFATFKPKLRADAVVSR